MASLEDEFADMIMDIYRKIRAEVYNPSLFFQMISDYGPLAAAQTLLNGPDVSEGFLRLYAAGKLELTVEAVVLDPRWRPLFSENELNIARKRLALYGYSILDPVAEEREIYEEGWPTVRTLASALNQKAGKYRIGRLQKIRKELKGATESANTLV